MDEPLRLRKQRLVRGAGLFALALAAQASLMQLEDHADDLRVVALLEDTLKRLLAQAAVLNPQAGVVAAHVDEVENILPGEQAAQHAVPAGDGQIDG